MPRSKKLHDEIGPWSEIKLDIVKQYAQRYSTIMSASRQSKFYHVYIDAFAGSGTQVLKRTGEYVPGSPRNALLVEPPFREYHLIDLDGDKVSSLKHLESERQGVHIYEEDCNSVLLRDIFPRVRYEDFRR